MEDRAWAVMISFSNVRKLLNFWISAPSITGWQLQHTDYDGRHSQLFYCLSQQAWHRSQYAGLQGSSAVFHSHPSSNGIQASTHWGLPCHEEGSACSYGCEDMRQLWELLMLREASPMYFPTHSEVCSVLPTLCHLQTRTHQPQSIRQLMGSPELYEKRAQHQSRVMPDSHNSHCHQQWNTSKKPQR